MQKRVVEPQADETRTEGKVARAEPSRGAPDAEQANPEHDVLEDQPFYELMQAYRHTPGTQQKETIVAFEDVKNFVRNQVAAPLKSGHVVLLEALRACVREMEDAASLLEFFPDDYGEAINLARAAIKQAERT